MDISTTGLVFSSGCVFLFGLLIGSFLNVVVYRTEHSMRLIKGRSQCPNCGNRIRKRDLIPVISYLARKRKCYSCGQKISLQYPLVELITGISYMLAFLKFGFSVQFLTALLLYALLICLSCVDIQKGEIPYWCSIGIAVLGLASLILTVIDPKHTVWYEHLIGACIIAIPFAVFAYFGAMGGGDVQLVAAAGLLLGWAIVPATLIALISASLFGLVVKLLRKSATICFGPFLSLGIAAGYAYGYEIIEWYLSLIR